MDFGRYLKELRITRGLSMRELSRRSGISQAYISQMERGERGTPKPEIIFSLYPHLNVSYNKLMNAAGYLVKDEEFTEEEMAFHKQIEDGAQLLDFIKFHPVIDGKEVSLSELKFAVDVIRSLREQKKD